MPIWETHDLTIVADSDGIIPWLESRQPDPGLWYHVATMPMASLGNYVANVKWILSQPECPNTVAAMLIHSNGPRYFEGKAPCDKEDALLFEMVQLILTRDANGGFINDTLSDPPNMNRGQAINALQVARENCLKAGRQPIGDVPSFLKVTPTGPLPETEFEMDESSICMWVPRERLI